MHDLDLENRFKARFMRLYVVPVQINSKLKLVVQCKGALCPCGTSHATSVDDTDEKRATVIGDSHLCANDPV